MNIASTCLSVSFVVPVLNEEGTIEALVDRLHAAMRDRGDNSYEIILIDDGSSDRSWPIMQALGKSDPKVVSYRMRRNFGKGYRARARRSGVTGGGLDNARRRPAGRSGRGPPLPREAR